MAPHPPEIVQHPGGSQAQLDALRVAQGPIQDRAQVVPVRVQSLMPGRLRAARRGRTFHPTVVVAGMELFQRGLLLLAKLLAGELPQ